MFLFAFHSASFLCLSSLFLCSLIFTFDTLFFHTIIHQRFVILRLIALDSLLSDHLPLSLNILFVHLFSWLCSLCLKFIIQRNSVGQGCDSLQHRLAHTGNLLGFPSLLILSSTSLCLCNSISSHLHRMWAICSCTTYIFYFLLVYIAETLGNPCGIPLRKHITMKAGLYQVPASSK